MLKNLGNIIVLSLLALLSLILLLLLSPLIFFSKFNTKTEEKKFETDYRQYLLKIDGHKIFCYNNRKDSLEFIEQQIIPFLPADVKLIFLDGRRPVSDYPEAFSSTVLYKIHNQMGFPYLLKVQDGMVFEKSINNELYNSLNQGHYIKSLYSAINKFYQ